MAERIVHQLIDDIDGSEIHEGGGESIQFSLRGVEYHIDLSTANVAKLEKALKPFVDKAQKVRGARRTPQKAAANVRDTVSREHTAAIREWARKKGFEVSSRGRIKADVVKAFEAAH